MAMLGIWTFILNFYIFCGCSRCVIIYSDDIDKKYFYKYSHFQLLETQIRGKHQKIK